MAQRVDLAAPDQGRAQQVKPVQRLGILSGTGVITRPAIGTTGGTLFLVGDNPFSGIYSQFFGGYFGSDHVLFSLPNATIFSNESFIVAAPEGVKVLEERHPEVEIFTAALDEGLNDKTFIVPGLGDFGDRLFGTG